MGALSDGDQSIVWIGFSHGLARRKKQASGAGEELGLSGFAQALCIA